jgi:hypothetical protein
MSIDDVSPPIPDVDYVEGAIVWTIQGVSLMSESQWDLVDQLWAYMIDGVIQLLDTGKFETYFPDQPLRLAFTARSGNRVEVAVGEEKNIVDREALVTSLADGGKRFFWRMKELVPKRNITWKRYLDKIEGVLLSHGKSGGDKA